MERGGWGGVKVGNEKIRSLAYADDIVLLAEDEGEMLGMIKKLERYLNRKRLVLNVEKTKIMRLSKGGGREKKVCWKCKGKEIEEVNKYTYLGI